MFSRSNRILFGVVASLCLASSASAQFVSADRVIFGAGSGCEVFQGAGTPEGAVVGDTCDVYIRTNPASASTVIYVKASGTATNTGWAELQGRPIARGDLPALIAYEDEANTFSVSQTISVASAPAQLAFSTPTATALIGVDTDQYLYAYIPPAGERLRSMDVASALRTTSPDGDLTIAGNLYPVSPYAQHIGSPVQKWGSLHVADLLVDNLVAQEVSATTGGKILVGPTTELTADLDDTATTITVRHRIFEGAGEVVMLEEAGKVEFMAVTSAATVSSDATSLSFDGVNDGATIAPPAAALTLPDASWSLGGWVKVTSNAGSGTQTLAAVGATSGSVPRFRLEFHETSAGSSPDDICVNVVDDAGDGTGDICSTTNPGLTTEWQHVLVVRTGTSYAIYVNGSSVATGTAATVDATTPSTDWFFGTLTDNSSPFSGKLSSWAKWDRALSGAEIGFLAKGYDVVAVGGAAWRSTFNDSAIIGALFEDVSGVPVELVGATSSFDHPYIKTYSHTVTRNTDGSGANYWAKGDAVFNTQNGWIGLDSGHGLKAARLDYIFVATSGGTVFGPNVSGLPGYAFIGTAVSDAIYFGRGAGTWEDLFFNFENGNAAPSNANIEYWNGSAWTAVSGSSVSSAFWTSDGPHSIQWSAGSQTGWAATTVNGVSAYWVRVRLVTLGSFTTSPRQVGRRVSYTSPEFGPVITFNRRNTSAALDFSTTTVIGNLLGTFGYTSETFGFAAGSTTTTAVTVDSGNCFRILYGLVSRAQWDCAGNLTIGSDATENFHVTSTDAMFRDATTELLTINGVEGVSVLVPDSLTAPSAVKSFGFNYGDSGFVGGLRAWNQGSTSLRALDLNVSDGAGGHQAVLTMGASGDTPGGSVTMTFQSANAGSQTATLNNGAGVFRVTGSADIEAQNAARYTDTTPPTLTTGTTTTISWNTNVFVQGTMPSAGSTIALPIAGGYFVTVEIEWPGSSAGSRVIEIVCDGAAVRRSRVAPMSGNTTNQVASALCHTNANNDILQIDVIQDSGGNVTPTGANLHVAKIY